MKYRRYILFFIAIASGIYLSLMYVNPYIKSVTLSEMILQLSGSRGKFPLEFSYSELASFGMRLFPTFIFELYAGIMLYHHFCTASVYVFSRYPYRTKWYLKEAFHLGVTVCFFYALVLLAVILTTICRYELQPDYTGMFLLIYHFCIHCIWIYIMTMSVNLLAIYFGSGTAYVIVISLQLICIVLLNVMDLLVRHSMGCISYETLLTWNPVSHLVIGWHIDNPAMTDAAIAYPQMNQNLSITVFLVIAITVTAVGAVIIKRHDLLVSSIEEAL